VRGHGHLKVSVETLRDCIDVRRIMSSLAESMVVTEAKGGESTCRCEDALNRGS